MAAPRLNPGQVVGATAAVMVPGAAVWILLVATGQLDPLVGCASFAAAALGAGVVMRARLMALAAVRGMVDRMIEGQPVDVPAIAERAPMMSGLAASIARLGRAGQQRADMLKAVIDVRNAMLDAIPGPLLVLDAGRYIRHANEAARGFFGASVVGRDLEAVMRAPAILDGVAQALAGRGAQTVDWDLSTPHERHFTVHVQALPGQGIATAASERLVAVIALHDVTALRRSEQMRADFIANASHELRTPLSTLIGFIETLRGPARDDAEARDRFLPIMHEQAQRMARLVEDLMSLSRIELNEHLPPTQAVAVREVVEHVAAALELQAARRRIRIQVACPDDLPDVVGARDELTQLLQNLIDNAIKYGRPGSTVRVAASRPARPPPSFPRAPHGAVALAVADEGQGIAREHLPRLTERFYRVDVARSRDVGGTGLGLAIVKHIVGRHRGALTIESEVGRGSVFTVYLPAVGNPVKDASRPARAG